jgi:hypothetical protein
MEINVGTKDGHIRIALGAVIILIALFLVEQPVIRILLAIIAAVLAGTAFLHHCPLYKMMGKNTCEDKGVAGSMPEAAPAADEPTPDALEEAAPAETRASEESSERTP